MKVLIVDDSVVFRTQIAAALSGIDTIEVAGSAPNGRIALQRLEQMQVDLVTLDIEMPEMDGLAVLKEIRKRNHRVRVIIFSSKTHRGAEKALLALEAGADDVIAKPSGNESIKDLLVPKILQFSQKKVVSNPLAVPRSSAPASETFTKRSLQGAQPSIIVIASSTGGPNALETIFSKVAQPIGIPILVAQHMPPVFTQILARRIADLSHTTCREAVHGEVLKSGCIYIAPGDYHMQLRKNAEVVQLELTQGPKRNSVRPAADYLFETAAENFGPKCLGIVLTGMGQDGLDGCIALKRAGSKVLIQDENSCVVFGMPGAVFKADCYDAIGNLDQISQTLSQFK
jgi:two-component system chemotaxis response regulator CheB